MDDAIRRSPNRSPRAVAEAIKDLIAGQTVCDVGCAEGDMMAFMSRYALQVIGFDSNPRRYQVAERRGFRVISGNYHLDDLPEADVYYIWPDNGMRDDRFLVDRILGRTNFRGTIILGGDSNVPSEEAAVLECATLGRLLRIPFNEGSGYRQSGAFLLAIIDSEAKASNQTRFSLEKRAVVSMAIGDGFGEMAALSIPGQVAYARRLGADHIVLREPLLGAHSPFYEIFQIHRFFQDYERILYLDIDVLVRDDCPDLFAQVPAESLGVFFESRLINREKEIRHIQKLWPALGWTGDYFNNGVLAAGQQHKDLFKADFAFPKNLRFADQTVMNYRAIAAGFALFDIGYGFNYMPAILPHGSIFRFCLNRTGPGVFSLRNLYQALPEPENAFMLHCAGFPYLVKLRLARNTLELWKSRKTHGFSSGHRSLNRVFGGLIPRHEDGVVLDRERTQHFLRFPLGMARPVDGFEVALWDLCDGKRSAGQIISGICKIFPDHPQRTLQQRARLGLHDLLNAGSLVARNQAEPVFADES
jgi:hypothetical protein